MRTHLFGDSVLAPVLVCAAWSVEPENDQIGIKVSERIGDRRQRWRLQPTRPNLSSPWAHVQKLCACSIAASEVGVPATPVPW